MSTRHIAAEYARLHDLTPEGSSRTASKDFQQKLAADGFTVEKGFQLKPGYLYTVVRAISARVNQNYDGWPSEELKKSYKTFIGKPVFVNHENHDPTKARGVVVAARYVENGMDKYVEVVQEVDAQRFPKLAHEIKTGGLDSVSMGAEAGFTICSYCKNKATDLHDMCDHVKNHKGKTLTKFDRRTGKKEDILVFESCHKISFFELSYVFEPADETAVASKVVVAAREPGESYSQYSDRMYAETYGKNYQPCLSCGSDTDAKDRETGQPVCPNCMMGDHLEIESLGSDLSPDKNWNPDEDPFDPRTFGASRRTAEDLAVPAPPGTKTIDQSVIDATPVINLSPATELTGHEAPGLPKSSGKYTKEDFANAGGKKPWESESETAVASKVVVAGLNKQASYEDDLAEWNHYRDVGRFIRPGDTMRRSDSTYSRPTRNLLEHPVINDFLKYHFNSFDSNDIDAGEYSVDPPTDSRNYIYDRENAGNRLDDDEKAALSAYTKHREENFPGWDAWWKHPDRDGELPSGIGYDEHKSWRQASHRTAADDLAVPAPPGTKTIDQSVIDATPVINLSPATELTGHEAPGLPKSSGKYTKEDFANAGGKKPWESESDEDDAAAIEIEAMLLRTADMEVIPQNSRRTQRPGTEATYNKVHDFFDQAGAPHDGGNDGVLDYGAGLGHSAKWGHTYEPHPDENGSFKPTWLNPEDVPSGKFNRLTNIHVLNVVPPEVRHEIVDGIGRAMAPGGHAVIVTRSKADVDSTKNKVDAGNGDPGAYHVFDPNKPDDRTYQKGFTPDELHQYVSDRLGPGYSVAKIPGKHRLSAPAVHVIKHADDPSERITAVKKIARQRALKLAFGETEAPMAVNTLREEGSAPEDDDDQERYVDPADTEFATNTPSPQELMTPDLSEAGQIDREQEAAGATTDQMGGIPGAADGGAPGMAPQQPQQQFMTLQIPIPASAPQVPMQAGAPVAAPPQQPPMQMAASTLDYFDHYYGRRVANWMDAIEARREMSPAEAADYRRQVEKLSTLENRREHSTTNRNPTKGTANMARSNIASRGKVATAGRRQHFAEGPLVDGGDRSRNDQGEQEEAFISQTPPEVSAELITDDTPNISNTEHNLVARVQQGRDQLLRDARQLAALQQRRASGEAGGPTATVVDPTVNAGPGAEELTGNGFVSADPNDGVVPTNPKDASLRAFQAFDGWLSAKTGKSSRRHTEANIKKAAAAFSREAGISPQALFPALGIVLREARKNDKKANKGAAMKKRANESLEVAAPDGRIDVTTPVKNTDAEAQASQFDLHDFGNNAGDNVAKPDLSTDQNWAPGEASGKKAAIKTAGGLLAMRCAEAMIEAGLEPNDRERKYALAAEFENMNRGLIQDRVALLERFAAVRQADLRKVASGSSRGAARSPIPAGLGGGTRTAGAGMRMAAHDPSNDSGLFI